MEQETEMQMVRRHVTEGTAHVKRQREIVAELRARGESTVMAVALLEQFEDLLLQHEAHLMRINPTAPPKRS